MQIESGNADGQQPLAGKAALAGKHDLVVLAQLLSRPGLQDGAVRIADAIVAAPGPAIFPLFYMGAWWDRGDGTWAGRG